MSKLTGARGTLLVMLAGVLLTCDAGERTADRASKSPAGISISLAPPGRWHQLNVSGTFMTTPRWLPDGSGVIASGYLGTGLYHLTPDGLEAHVIDPEFRGLVTFENGGRSLCLRPSAGSEVLAFDVKGLKAGAVGQGCAPPPVDPARVLLEAGGVRILHDALYGALTWADGEGETVIEDAAWSAAAAPDGSFVAYCTGHLTDPALFVYGRDHSRIEIGKGAHPAWLPGGRFLVFARPEADGTGRVVRSELYVFDTRTRLTARLTDTPGIVEMQPAVSPDGGSLAFSDWRSGAVMVAPLEEGAP